jgi:3',5'-cyclic AMP phosphodiesterase CpdA
MVYQFGKFWRAVRCLLADWSIAVGIATGPLNCGELRFGADGKFKVMVVADVQDGARVSSYTLHLLELALDREMPDLVVLGGDNIFDWSPSLMLSRAGIRASISTFMRPIVSRGIPFAVVFGNHDRTPVMGKDEQWDFFQTFPGALGQ